MVPISFESITRSAGLQALNALPVSAAARATHESFESHLQRAIAPQPGKTIAPVSRDEKQQRRSDSLPNETRRDELRRDEPARSESKPQPSQEVRTQPSDHTRPAAADSKSNSSDEDEPEQDTALEQDVVAAAATEQRAAPQKIELDADGQVDESTEEAAAEKLRRTSLAGDALESDDASAGPDAESEEDADGTSSKNQASAEKSARAVSEARGQTKAGGRSVEGETTEHESAQKVDASSLVGDSSKTDDQPDDTSKPRTSAPRRGNRSELVGHPASDPIQAASDTAVEDAVLAPSTAEGNEKDNAEGRQNQNRPEAISSIGNATTRDASETAPGAPSRFAQHLLVRNGEQSGRGPGITEADQARFVDRVARAVHATGERGGTLRIRLSPPELGAMTLEVKVQGGSVTAHIEADTPAARTLLLENLPLLRERLAEQGMRIDQFDVDLSDRHTGGTPDDLQQNDHQQQDRSHTQNRPNEPEESTRTPSKDVQKNGDEQLNIIV